MIVFGKCVTCGYEIVVFLHRKFVLGDVNGLKEKNKAVGACSIQQMYCMCEMLGASLLELCSIYSMYECVCLSVWVCTKLLELAFVSSTVCVYDFSLFSNHWLPRPHLNWPISCSQHWFLSQSLYYAAFLRLTLRYQGCSLTIQIYSIL